MEKGTKLYYKGSNYELLEYTFLRNKNGNYEVEDRNGVLKVFKKTFFDRLCMSKIMILSEMEEELRSKINDIHTEMRKFKLSYNPLDSVMVIYTNKKSRSNGKIVEVHQYSLKTGKYIASFRSATQAAYELGHEQSSSHISAVCRDTRNSSLGYRWSYRKIVALPPIKRRSIHNSISIAQYNSDMEIVKIFNSIKEAVAYSGITIYAINKLINDGKSKKHKGFYWRKLNT